MVCCCIFGCNNNSNKNRGVGFYLVPKVISWQCSKTYNLSSERRALWLQRINRQNFNEKTIEGSRVCGAHFASGKPATLFDNNNVDWAPSLALGYEEGEELEYKRGRWVKCKKRKLINIKTVTSTSATQSGDFIMLDGVDGVNYESDDTTSCHHKITNVDIQSNKKICLNKDSDLKDVSCQTDIKCEYIGHLETHVVHLRSEVKNLQQQIEQYEAYYQMMSENNGSDNENNSAFKCEEVEDDSPHSKKYKLTLKSNKDKSLQNESDLNQDDDNISEKVETDDEDYISLIPQVVIKEEPEELSDNDNISDYDSNVRIEEVMIKEESTKSQNYDSESSCDEGENGNSIDEISKTTELNDNTSDSNTCSQVRKSSRPRKRSKKLCDDYEASINLTKYPRCTAYSLWSKEKRPIIMKSNSNLDFSAISKLLSDMWKKVSKSEKYVWQTKAKDINNKFLKVKNEKMSKNTSGDSTDSATQ